ncbi:hypothetical protein [Kordia jejudonensis]|uniref:hypothetical protein n=1 Tax=Kordia jejudonensis TaxID=1348245 RepID=UPI000629C9E5|nr:hypothetical protein [Kordia jejudonensis]
MADVLKGTDKQKAIQNLRLAIQNFSDKNTNLDKGEIYQTYMNLLPAAQLDSIEHYAALYKKYIPESESYESIIFITIWHTDTLRMDCTKKQKRCYQKI